MTAPNHTKDNETGCPVSTARRFLAGSAGWSAFVDSGSRWPKVATPGNYSACGQSCTGRNELGVVSKVLLNTQISPELRYP
jgi:hypothetical protein